MTANEIAGVQSYLRRVFGNDRIAISPPIRPGAPVEVGNLPADSYSYDIALVGDRAYLADGDAGLRVIDIGDPSAPLELGSILLSEAALGVDVQGDYAFVAADEAGLRVVDISDPAALVETGSYDTADSARRIEVRGPYAYIADYNDGLQVIDISDPYAPFRTAYYDTGGRAQGLGLDGDYIYVADGRNGVMVLSSETIPVQLSFFRAERFGPDVRLDWELSWQDPGEGFRIYRREDGGPWVNLADLPADGITTRFEYYDRAAPTSGLGYRLTERLGGGEEFTLRSVELAPAESRTGLMVNHPNPFNPSTLIRFELAVAGPARLSVYDLRGRRLRVLSDGPMEAGDHAVEWDGRDETGRALPSGVYFARLHSALGGQDHKLVMAR